MTETTWRCFPLLDFKVNLLFPYVSTPSSATGKYTLRDFSCMVLTSCMSVAVSSFGAELLLGGNVLCNILMARYSLGVFDICTKVTIAL